MLPTGGFSHNGEAYLVTVRKTKSSVTTSPDKRYVLMEINYVFDAPNSYLLPVFMMLLLDSSVLSTH